MNGVAKSPLETREIKPKVGSVILADKDALLSGVHAAEIADLMERRGVLVFPKINFTDEEQLRFTRTLGNIAKENSGEEIFPITLDFSRSEGIKYLLGSFYWHFDGFSQPMPVRASILCAKILSPTGGNTEFANCYPAYDDLPEDEKAKLEGLRVVHSAWNTLLYYHLEPNQAELEAYMSVGEVELPLVWTHRSGRKSLVIGCSASHVVGMERKQSALLLNRLREWATSEPFHYSHTWSVGDMVMWDNTGSLHRATAYDPACGRELHRTKLEGEEPITA